LCGRPKIRGSNPFEGSGDGRRVGPEGLQSNAIALQRFNSWRAYGFMRR